MRVHLFNGQDIPPADSNGLADPVVEVIFRKHKQKSEVKRRTLFPEFYQTFVFNNELLPPSTEDMQYAPQVAFRVYDWDDLPPLVYLSQGSYDLKNAIVTPEYPPEPGTMKKVIENYLLNLLLHDNRKDQEAWDFTRLSDKQKLLVDAYLIVSSTMKSECGLLAPDLITLIDNYATAVIETSREEKADSLEGRVTQVVKRRNKLSDEAEQLVLELYDKSIIDGAKPQTLQLFKETPGDSQGSIMALVQLIPLGPEGVTWKSKPPKPTPPARDAFVEIVVVGLRDLAPFQFQPMQSPYLEIRYDFLDFHKSHKTAPSKKPEPSNPNYLEKVIIPCRIPINPIFCPPLLLVARDLRLGGFLKPQVGVGIIDLKTRIPWYDNNEEDLASPQASGSNASSVTAAANAFKQVLKKKKAPKPMEDLGCGIFAANVLTHDKQIPTQKKTVSATDDEEEMPKWALNRDVLESELEAEDNIESIFDTFPLYRGKVDGFLGSTVKEIGRLKCLIRVMRNLDDEPPKKWTQEILDNILKPKGCKIRLYALRLVGLAPMVSERSNKYSHTNREIACNPMKVSYHVSFFCFSALSLGF